MIRVDAAHASDEVLVCRATLKRHRCQMQRMCHQSQQRGPQAARMWSFKHALAVKPGDIKKVAMSFELRVFRYRRGGGPISDLHVCFDMTLCCRGGIGAQGFDVILHGLNTQVRAPQRLFKLLVSPVSQRKAKLLFA